MTDKKIEQQQPEKQQKLSVHFEGATEHFTKLRQCLESEMELVKLEREKLEEEKKQFEEVKAKVAKVHFASSIKIDVGGRIFKTGKSTLCKETSMLS